MLDTIKCFFMNINFTILTSREDCHQLLKQVAKERRGLAYKLEGLVLRHTNADGSGQMLEAEIQSVTSEIAFLRTFIEGLPDGQNKIEQVEKLQDLEYRLIRLVRQRSTSGVTAIVEREYDMGLVQAQIAEADAFITGITTHMNAIPE